MIEKTIAIDATILDDKTINGLNRYTSELIINLLEKNRKFHIYTSSRSLQKKYGEVVKYVKNSRINEPNFKGNLQRFVWHQSHFSSLLKKEETAIVYCSVPEGMIFPVCKQVITVHDILPLLFPNTYPRLKYYYKYILPVLIKSSSIIIATSQNTKKDIITHYNVPSDKIYVVYQGYKASIFKPVTTSQINKTKRKFNLSQFILCAGEMRPYKNIRSLILAFHRANLHTFDLVIVGKVNKMDMSIIDLPKNLGVKNQVKFLGYVSDEELAALYGGATTFVFPSLYEGFGIPPLEAMACGCPTIVSNASSIPEVAGDAAYYINPLSIESIAEALNTVVASNSLQNILREKGLRRATKFSYCNAAENLISLFDSIP